MRRFLTAALVICAAAALFMDAHAAEESAAAAVQTNINVRITCNGEALGDFSINGQSAALSRAHSTELSKSRGDTATFILVGGGRSGVNTVAVEPKEGVAWPFVGARPTFGSRGNRGTGAIDPNIALGSYGYNFVVTCGSTRVEIDPKMDIVP